MVNMGLLDDIKESIGDSDDSGGLGSSGSGSDNPFGETNSSGSFGQDAPSRDSPEIGNAGQSQVNENNPNIGNTKAQGNQNRNQPQQNNKPRRNSVEGQESRSGLSNPQAGRPQRGDSSPQLSQNTRKKIDNAGLEGNNQSPSNNSISNREIMDVLEEIRGQNQQMVDILEKISQNLERGSSRRR